MVHTTWCSIVYFCWPGLDLFEAQTMKHTNNTIRHLQTSFVEFHFFLDCVAPPVVARRFINF
jgi:hypothetical protein